MTITVVEQDPAPAATNVSPHTSPRFELQSDQALAPVDRGSIDVWLNGEQFVSGGVPVEGSQVVDNGVGGFQVVLDPGSPFPQEEPITVRVVADDTAAGSPIDTSWTFTVADSRGPILADAQPPPGSIATANPGTISLRIADPGTGFSPETARTDFVQDLVDLTHSHPELSGNQLLFPVQDFSSDGSTASDLFTSAGAYAFDSVGKKEVGQIIVVGNVAYRVIDVISSSQVQVDKDFPTTASGLDWSLTAHDLEGKEGRLFEVTSGPSTGERRRLTTIHGPTMASYDGTPLSGTSESINVFYDRGLDIVIDGVRVVHSGFLDADAATAGWAAAIVVLGNGDIDVSITNPVTWTAGRRVPVHILVADSNPDLVNISDINYFFDVVDTRGPQIVNVSPAEGKKGNDRLSTPNSDITFDIICTEGVDTSTLNVEVNGVAAITAGAGVGVWSGSTVTPITDGEQVVLKRSTDYTDGDTAFVEINVDDNSGRTGETRVLRIHFGVTNKDVAVTTGLGGTDIVRVIAYDINDTSFARPEALNHTGYAWDGYRYTNGNRTADPQASWFTELGAFPLAGHVVVTATNGWSIIKALDSAAWMTCVPATSPAWSMADNDAGPLTDADFGPDPVLSIAGNAVLLIDFTEDRAERYNTAGRVLSSGNITSRNSDQVGNLPNTSFALPVGPYLNLASHHRGPDLVMAVGTAGFMTVLYDVNAELLNTLVSREGIANAPDNVITRAVSGTWVRTRLGNLEDTSFTPLFFSYNDTGQGQVEVWDWFKFSANGSVELFLDDVSTPALAAAEIRDLHVSESMAIAAMMVGELNIVDYPNLSVATYTEADMGLSGVAGAQLSAVSLEPGFRVNEGFLYAAVAAVADGRLTRFRVHSPSGPDRVTTLSNGVPFTTVAAIGDGRHTDDRYIRTSIRII